MLRYERGHKVEVFTLKQGEWKVALDGTVLPIEWNSSGAADAGATVELKRRCPGCANGTMYTNTWQGTAHTEVKLGLVAEVTT